MSSLPFKKSFLGFPRLAPSQRLDKAVGAEDTLCLGQARGNELGSGMSVVSFPPTSGLGGLSLPPAQSRLLPSPPQ